MKTWQVQEAKARFSELLRASAEEGPQIVSLHGKPTAVVVPIAQWQRLQQQPARSPKALLLAPEARGELPLPERGRLHRRAPSSLA
ncbi:type II toxin-antitoxin system Phd/YefM family antitoxin [Luteimonas sp. XNQY3]|nr:type II toxin-antitoxin system Phd/YefM family antitoxin [Luteimonas sp. XNQY3]MCD9007039.1 type II toxin-antitoxin system Phd/YefM family antitoxin [Luteimonas sp. XNQY3]